jgi:O-antigen/teichoic acid export membrane protein
MPKSRPAGRILADGAARGFAAEFLLLPTGLVTAAVLARVLGPVDYGRFSLVSSMVMWLTMTSVAVLGRAAIKLLSDAEDWRPVAATMLRMRVAIGAAGAGLLVVGADAAERILGAEGIAPLLRVFALDVLLINLVRAHRETLTGIGQYRDVATISAVRWIARMVLMVVLVLWLRSVLAAVIASVLTSAIELAVAARLQPLPWRATGGPSARRLWDTAAPLLVFGLTFQLHTRIDLFALSSLQRHAVDVAQATGWYGAAQNLAVVPSLFMMTVAPLLLATLSRLVRDGHEDHARRLANDVLRFTVWLVPGVAIVVVSASELVLRIFGLSFAGAAPLLGLLFASGEALCLLAVAVSILIAADRSRLVSWLGVLLLGSSMVGQLILVPRYGALGAAMATLASAVLACTVALAGVHRAWGIHALATTVRVAILGGVVSLVGSQLTTTTWWGLIIKLALLSMLSIGGLLVLRELSPADRQRLLAWRASRELGARDQLLPTERH